MGRYASISFLLIIFTGYLLFNISPLLAAGFVLILAVAGLTIAFKDSPIMCEYDEKRYCYNCGAEMKLRPAKRGKYKGQFFYVCKNYPRCKCIVDLSGGLVLFSSKNIDRFLESLAGKPDFKCRNCGARMVLRTAGKGWA